MADWAADQRAPISTESGAVENEAMDRLGDDERSVLELVMIDELTVAEAAVATGVRPVTARVRLHRARRKLRAELGEAVAPPDETKR